VILSYVLSVDLSILYVASFPICVWYITFMIFSSFDIVNCSSNSSFSNIPSVSLFMLSLFGNIVYFPLVSSSVSLFGYLSLALKSPIMYVGPSCLNFSNVSCSVVYVFSFSSEFYTDVGMYVVIMLMGNDPASVMYMVLSSIGSMSSMCFASLLCITNPTPWLLLFCPFPLKYHV
jgi:hypothetical protein